MTPEENAALDARRLKRLEMIQAIVARMAQNSFVIKGWATTFCAAIIALGAKDASAPFALLATPPAIIFWTLDAYYLLLERRYRALYEKAVADFDPGMSLSFPDAKHAPADLTLGSTLRAPVVYRLYGVIVVLSLVIAYANRH